MMASITQLTTRPQGDLSEFMTDAPAQCFNTSSAVALTIAVKGHLLYTHMFVTFIIL